LTDIEKSTQEGFGIVMVEAVGVIRHIRVPHPFGAILALFGCSIFVPDKIVNQLRQLNSGIKSAKCKKGHLLGGLFTFGGGGRS